MNKETDDIFGLRAEFLAEAAESMAELDVDLVSLEKDPGNAALLDRVFRLVHTIKGAAGFLDLPRLASVTHAVEDLLGQMRAKDVRPSAAVVTQILRALDLIRTILTALEQEGAEPVGDDQGLIDALASHAGPDTVDLVPTSEAELEALFDAAPGPPRTVAGEVLAPGAPAAQESATALHETTPPPATVRVGVEVLEHLLTTVGELVLTRNQLLLAAHNGDDLGGVLQRLDQVTAALQDDMLKTRMQPVQTIWAKIPRMVRDAAHHLGKRIAVEMEGGDTELDRQVLEHVRDPLLHLVRNAADHGIESPDERRAAGKPEEGRIALEAKYLDGQIVIEVSDDGRGLDLARIREKAIAAGLVTAERAARLNDSEIRAFLMQPGFSTADQVTELSGRGVGLDVVRANIEMIGGSIDMLSLAGEGTTTTLKIPLTLAIIPVLMIGAGAESFALPQVNVQEIVRVGSGPWHRLESLHGRPCLRLRGALIPVLPLSDVLGLEAGAGEVVVIIKIGAETFGLLVDGVFDTQEIIVKPVAPVLRHIAVFSGMTILGDGTVAMILDTVGLARAMGAAASPPMAAPTESEELADTVETVDFLTFRAGQAALKAVPLRMLTRIESIDLSTIETTDDRTLVQHRGHILPLVPAGAAAISPTGHQPVLIFETAQGAVGLVVDQVVDIVQVPTDIALTSASGRSVGGAVIDGQVTEFVELGQFLSAVLVAGAAREAKLRVLLIDGNALSRRILPPFLSHFGYAVTAVPGAANAFELQRRKARFDTIVIDLHLPGVDGFELAEQFAAVGDWKDIPLIGHGDTLSAADMARAARLGFQTCVLKFDHGALQKSLVTSKSLALEEAP